PRAQHRGPTLARRLAALVALVALPLLGLAAWSVWAAQGGVREQAERALLERVQGIALALEREFDRAEVLLQALAASAALGRGDLGAMDEEMRAASRAVGGLPVTLIGTDGTILLSTLRARGDLQEGVPAPEEARRLLAEGRIQVTNLFEAPLSGLLTVSVAVPLRAVPEAGEAARRTAAGIGLSFPRERFAELLREASGLGAEDMAAGWTASMLDRRGVSVARSGGEEGVVGRPARPEIARLLETGRTGVLHGLTTREGMPVITAILRGQRSGYGYVMTMPRAAFAAPLRTMLLRTVLVGGAVLAVGFGLAVLLARRTVGAFRAVREAATSRVPPPPTGL
ncbi:hypothetical protein, partial [Falsiroseomonas oryzae]|uniref:hypothetical protein n=1 Tax=Falsiroseomonas oryzae TaxID=2766473 RepID=UPI0022EA3EF0